MNIYALKYWWLKYRYTWIREGAAGVGLLIFIVVAYVVVS